ncbi:MAG: DUF6036 family nucleotidyltransferase [Opitutaceae bacterium]
MPTRIVLFGRAALALGYDPPEPEFEVTNDVDAILPSVDMAAIERDEQFWNAIDAANRELEPAGLYITHLFSDQQVVITPHWLSRVVPIPFEGGRHLRLFRPAGADLLLTKMMRNDPQDLEDIRFILRRDRITRRQVMDVFAEARIPDVNEIREIFMSLRTVVESMAAEINS